MATSHFLLVVIFFITSLFHDPKLCLGLNLKKHLSLLSGVEPHWASAGATWYGSPDGAGSDGGACGYGGTVSQDPFSSLVTGIGPSLYKSGKGCGRCYKDLSAPSVGGARWSPIAGIIYIVSVKCTKHPSCSTKPVTVVITDYCPGGTCAVGSAHFDLSGTAFGAMAIPGQEEHLRDAGVLEIRYARVACDYPGKTIAFHVDEGSNPNYFAVVIQFEEGDGDLASVEIIEESLTNDGNGEWLSLQQSWGADWKINPGRELHAPFSIRLRSQYSNNTLVAKNVIPVGWKPGATYRSMVNY